MDFFRGAALRSMLGLVVASLCIGVLAPSGARATTRVERDPFGSGVVDGKGKGAVVEPAFFGLQYNLMPAGAEKWPVLSPSAIRMDLFWKDIEREPGSYRWAAIDDRMSAAEASGAKPLFAILATPLFHAMDRSGATFASPPRVAAYSRFVEALVSRYGTRADYQVWNEPNVSGFFTGTARDVARMTAALSRAVRKRAPSATVVAPSFPLRGDSDAFRHWFKRYWAQRINGRPMARFVDVASISAYPMVDGDAEDGLAITRWARRILSAHGFSGPLWATEINYGANGGAPTHEVPMRREVSNVARTFVLHASLGADRVYWWMWTPNATVNTELQYGTGELTPSGVAFQEVREWLVGAKPTGCTTKHRLTTCAFKVGKRAKRYVFWSRSGRTRTVVAPSGARIRVGARGTSREITSGTKFRVGLVPVMVETRGKK